MGCTFRIRIETGVKEQQKRIGSAEYRNTHFSYILGETGVEQFVSTPELQSDSSIGTDPLEPSQVWCISEGGRDIDDNAGLYCIEVNKGPGSSIKILNKPVPQAFQESVRFAQQNLYSNAVQLVGDRDPRDHEFSLQLRSFNALKKGAKLGIPALIAMCCALLKTSVRGGLIVVGELNLGGSIEPIYNAVNIVELLCSSGVNAR